MRRGNVRAAIGALLGLFVGVSTGFAAQPADAFEFWDGRLAVHGFYELQLRGISADFQPNAWDMTQMAHVLNLEIEADIAPDGFGPIDLVTGFARLELRYDCVWNHACQIFPSVNAFGNGSKRQPKRNYNGRRLGFHGTVPDGDTRYYRGEPAEEFRWAFRNKPRESRRPHGIGSVPGFDNFFASAGPDQILGTDDDPGPFFLSRYSYLPNRRCKFTNRRTRGSVSGRGQLTLGPIDPACGTDAIAPLAEKPNPFRSRDYNPLIRTGGGLDLPFRPSTETSNLTGAPDWEARGLWIPHEKLADALRRGEIDQPPHFSQHDLTWNRGLHQRTWRELKEIYLDIEMFDSRLWLRVGKQTIVWGKTELFRNQDQFNPQDLALSSLPSLEESRTALWSARGIWSFYDVGPLQDVRVELAFNFDRVLPGDFGQCGEPYTVYLVCAGAFGAVAHGIQGLGLAGVKQLEDPWESWKAIEVGARVEWRWDRFSFAITDFWGYDDIPVVERLFAFERNVDPITGRPRVAGSRETCKTGREGACLRPGGDALRRHHANQTSFATSCAATLGVSDLDPTACGFTIFNSTNRTLDDPTDPGFALAPRLVLALTNTFSGQGTCSPTGFPIGGTCPVASPFSGAIIYEGLANFNLETATQLARFPHIRRYGALPEASPPFRPKLSGFPGGAPTPLVPLSRDPGDGPASGDSLTPEELADPAFAGSFLAWRGTGIAPFLTDEQEALLGCGAFYQTRCDIDGIDFLNAEASAVFQSFVGIDGTFGNWSTLDGGVAQPGTSGFQGGPVCTRFERGRTFILPGCRGRGDPGYDPRKDGTTTGGAFFVAGLFTPGFDRRHPFTGQRFRSEMAVFSWNFMMALVGFSRGTDTGRQDANGFPIVVSDEDQFDPNRPLRQDGCSFAKPQLCQNVRSFFNALATTRNVVQAGGNPQFGRRDFIWHHGNPVLVSFDKRNVLGFSMDFAEDVTKTNWSFEATWFNDIRLNDANKYSGLTSSDLFNLTVSVDRPTFINFLNANRTFFFNAQMFFRYINGYQDSFSTSGPWSMLLTLTAQTGYLQDRMLAGATFVYDKKSNSGAFLPQVTYRFTENFSATFGIALFFGRSEPITMAVNPIASRNRAADWAYNDFAENGLSVVRERDEAFLRVRYTF